MSKANNEQSSARRPKVDARASSSKATVNDMIEWLWWGGWYGGVVCWVRDFSDDEIFSSNKSSEGILNTLAAHHAPFEFGSSQGHTPWYDFTMMDQMWAHEKYIRHMIKTHLNMLPKAVAEIDRRLQAANLSLEEYDVLKEPVTALSAVYEKIQLLERDKQRIPPVRQIQIRVVCSGMTVEIHKPLTVNLYIPTQCALGQFESIAARILPNKVIEHLSDPKAQGSGLENTWNYRIIEESDDIYCLTEGTWLPLHNQTDFTRLMEIVENDKSKLAVVCHGVDIEDSRNVKPPEQWADISPEDMWRALGLDTGQVWSEEDQIHWGEEWETQNFLDAIPEEVFDNLEKKG